MCIRDRIQTTDTVLNNLLSWSAHMATEAIWGYGYGAQPGISVFSYNRISSGDFRKKSFVGADRSFEMCIRDSRTGVRTQEKHDVDLHDRVQAHPHACLLYTSRCV